MTKEKPFPACPGRDRALSAADPDWLAQAERQMSELFYTLEEINDPTCKEAWDNLELALLNLLRSNRAEGDEQ